MNTSQQEKTRTPELVFLKQPKQMWTLAHFYILLLQVEVKPDSLTSGASAKFLKLCFT